MRTRTASRAAGILERYRRAGADLPFTDPARDHQSPFEGYYWRFTDAAQNRVVIALCGLTSEPGGGRWALAALATHPEGEVRREIMSPVRADAERFGVEAGRTVAGSARKARFELAGDAVLRVAIDAPIAWPRRRLGGSGLAQMVPGLPQYWHPHLLGGLASGELILGKRRMDLDGANVYAEKNWGRTFPDRWWWGQADAFDTAEVCVAFAGGPLTLPGLSPSTTLLVVRLRDCLYTFGPPHSRVSATVDGRAWALRACSLGHSVDIEGDDDEASAVLLPVPIPGRRASTDRSVQALAGRMRLVVRRGRRVLFRGESRLAGLERNEEGECV